MARALNNNNATASRSAFPTPGREVGRAHSVVQRSRILAHPGMSLKEKRSFGRPLINATRPVHPEAPSVTWTAFCLRVSVSSNFTTTLRMYTAVSILTPVPSTCTLIRYPCFHIACSSVRSRPFHCAAAIHSRNDPAGCRADAANARLWPPTCRGQATGGPCHSLS